MYNVEVASGILIDSTSVVFKGRRNSDTASNGSSLVDFLHHSLFSLNRAEFSYVVDVVLIRYEARLVRVAVLAHGSVGTLHTIVVTSGSVDGAGLVSDVGVVHELVGSNGFSSVTSVSVHLARDDNLGRDVDVWPLCISGNLYSV